MFRHTEWHLYVCMATNHTEVILSHIKGDTNEYQHVCLQLYILTICTDERRECAHARVRCVLHYSDVIMATMASHLTSLTIVYSTIYSGADQRKHLKLRVTGLCAGNSPVTGEFPAQMASNAENVSILWRHHGHIFISIWPLWSHYLPTLTFHVSYKG